ncbi:MAG: heavy-metal-associated domain-containing protein [Bdellovibrionales bacterium]
MYEIKVSGMTCGSCANSMSYALKSIDPNVEVSVDLKSQTVKVKSNREQTEITALIEEAGYPVLGARKL